MPSSSRKSSLRSVDEEDEEMLSPESLMLQLFEDVEAACDPFRSQHNSPTGTLRLSKPSAPRLSLPTSFESPTTPTQASFSSQLLASIDGNNADSPPRPRTTRGSSLPELSQHYHLHHLEDIQPLQLIKLRSPGTTPVIPKRTSSFGWETETKTLSKPSRRFPLPPAHLPPKDLPPTPTPKAHPLSPSPSLTSSTSSASSSSPTFLLTPPSTPEHSSSKASVDPNEKIRIGSKMDALEEFLRGMDFGEGAGVDEMAERRIRREEAQKWGRWEAKEVKEWRGRVGGGGRRR